MATIEISESAARKARALLERAGTPEQALRVRVVDGGCSGMRYELLFDDAAGPDDELSEQHGLRVVIDPESAKFLEGTRVDYVDDLNDSGFKVENPRAETTCGCGESFNIA